MKATKWTGGGHTHKWFDPRNWSNGVPVAGAPVIFRGSSAFAVNLAGPQAAQSDAISVTGDAVTFSSGTLTASTAQPSSGYRNDLTIGGGGSVTLGTTATLVSPDAITLGATVAGTFTSGTLAVHGTLDASILEIAQGSMLVGGHGAHVGLSLGQFVGVGNGSLTVAHGGTLDAGPDTLKVFYSDMYVGSGLGAGIVNVTGAGSSLTLGIVYLGNGYNGYLNVTAGGAAHLGVIYAGNYGDGTITVSGAGSVLTAVNAVVIGDVNVLPVGSAIDITHGGSVDAGYYGLDLHYGLLALDASASLTGTIVSQVGKIEALPAGPAASTVILNNAIVLQSNDGAQGQYDHATTVYAQGATTLDLGGLISGDTDAVLSAGSGHVVLGNAANSYSATSLFDATLEIARTGAAGVGTLTFTGGAGQAPVLRIDAGVAFANTIAGFAGQDAIDLRGFAFGSGVTDQFAGGVLTLSDGSSTTTLSVAGSYTAGNFVFADDHHGGTVMTFLHG